MSQYDDDEPQATAELAEKHHVELKIMQQVKTGDALVEQAQAMMITTAPHYEAACAMLLTAKAGSRACDEAFDEDIGNWNHGHKNALATKKRYQDPFLKIEVILKPRIRAYQDEQEHQRQLAQKKAQEEAQLAEAIHHEALGDNHAAQEVLDGRGVVSVTVPALPTMPKVDGIVSREAWKYEIVDGSIIPREYLLINEAKIGQVVRAMKSETKIPGIRVIRTSTISASCK